MQDPATLAMGPETETTNRPPARATASRTPDRPPVRIRPDPLPSPGTGPSRYDRRGPSGRPGDRPGGRAQRPSTHRLRQSPATPPARPGHCRTERGGRRASPWVKRRGPDHLSARPGTLPARGRIREQPRHPPGDPPCTVRPDPRARPGNGLPPERHRCSREVDPDRVDDRGPSPPTPLKTAALLRSDAWRSPWATRPRDQPGAGAVACYAARTSARPDRGGSSDARGERLRPPAAASRCRSGTRRHPMRIYAHPLARASGPAPTPPGPDPSPADPEGGRAWGRRHGATVHQE